MSPDLPARVSRDVLEMSSLLRTGPVNGLDQVNLGVNQALFPCFRRKSRYIPRHLTRKHGLKGRPVAAGPIRLVCSHVSGGTNRRIRLWRYPISLCVSYWKLACTLATN